MSDLRQIIMILYLSNSALDSDVRGWTIYDGSGQTYPTTGDSDTPPYPTGLAAMRDGWRVVQMPQLIPPDKDLEYTTSFYKFEYVFEKMVEVQA